MTVLMFQHRFIVPIQTGQKRQTIRPPRKRPIQVGEQLSLRHWEGKAYRSNQVEIKAEQCSGVLDIRVFDNGFQIFRGHTVGMQDGKKQLDEFAQCDGFDSWQAMVDYFKSPGGYGLPFTGNLILWR